MSDDTDVRTGTLHFTEPFRGAATLFSMLVTAVAVGLLLFLVSWAAPVIAPFAFGLFLAALSAPLFGWLRERIRSTPIAVAITVAAVVLTGGLVVVLVLLSARELAAGLNEYAAQMRARYPDLTSYLQSLGLSSIARDLLTPEALTTALEWVVDAVVAIAGTLAFAVVFAAMLLLDAPRLARLVEAGLGGENPVFREMPGVAGAAVTYFKVRIRINAVTAVGLLALMLVTGVDSAVLWAIGAFFLSFVPYLGLALALIPPTVLAFAESGALVALVVLIGGILLNVFAENVLEPIWTGKALRLTSWLVFLMFFFWVWLIGPVGALVSMPITVLLVLVLERNERTRWLAALLTRG
jgi:predicted PurR-regulated permease PerM